MAEKPGREERTEDYQSPAVKEMEGREGRREAAEGKGESIMERGRFSNGVGRLYNGGGATRGEGERTEENEDLRSSLQFFHSIDTISCR